MASASWLLVDWLFVSWALLDCETKMAEDADLRGMTERIKLIMQLYGI